MLKFSEKAFSALSSFSGAIVNALSNMIYLTDYVFQTKQKI